jgi:hypothetical protein
MLPALQYPPSPLLAPAAPTYETAHRCAVYPCLTTPFPRQHTTKGGWRAKDCMGLRRIGREP